METPSKLITVSVKKAPRIPTFQLTPVEDEPKPTGFVSLKRKLFASPSTPNHNLKEEKKTKVKNGDWKVYSKSEYEKYFESFCHLEELETLRLSLSRTTLKNEKCLMISQKPELVKYWFYILHPFYHYQFSYTRLEDCLKAHELPSNFRSLGVIKNAKGDIFPFPSNLFDLLDLLRLRKITGDIALGVVLEYMNIYKSQSMKLLIARILDKNLKVNASRNVINSIFEKLVPVFSVARGEIYEKVSKKVFDPKKESWFWSRKWDGIRCIIFLLPDKIEFMTRVGHSISFCLKTLENYFISLREAEAKIGQKNFMNVVIDCELISFGSSGNEDFRSVQISISRKQESSVTTFTTAHVMIIDMLDPNDFWNGTSSTTLEYRYNHLSKVYNQALEILPKTKTYMSLIKQDLVKSDEHVEELRKMASKSGWEGIMLRSATATYIGKKHTSMLKVKEFIEQEFKCVAVNTGQMPIRENGVESTVLAVTEIVIDLGNKNHCKVGSGFSNEQRIEFRNHPDRIIGKMVTIKYKGTTTNKDGGESLSFPVFKTIRIDLIPENEDLEDPDNPTTHQEAQFTLNFEDDDI